MATRSSKTSPRPASAAGRGGAPGTQPRRSPLSRERVLGAALALIDREGLAALSMRALGAELGVEAMSLYKHVGNKDDVLDGVVGLAVAEADWSVGGDGAWTARMEALSIQLRDVGLRHPDVFRVLLARPTSGQALLEPLEAMLTVLDEAGFDAAVAVSVFWTLLSYAIGAVLGEIDYEASGSVVPVEFFEEADSFPRTRAASAFLAGCSFEEEYLAGVRRILAGAEAERPKAKKAVAADKRRLAKSRRAD